MLVLVQLQTSNGVRWDRIRRQWLIQWPALTNESTRYLEPRLIIVNILCRSEEVDLYLLSEGRQIHSTNHTSSRSRRTTVQTKRHRQEALWEQGPHARTRILSIMGLRHIVQSLTRGRDGISSRVGPVFAKLRGWALVIFISIDLYDLAMGNVSHYFLLSLHSISIRMISYLNFHKPRVQKRNRSGSATVPKLVVQLRVSWKWTRSPWTSFAKCASRPL